MKTVTLTTVAAELNVSVEFFCLEDFGRRVHFRLCSEDGELLAGLDFPASSITTVKTSSRPETLEGSVVSQFWPQISDLIRDEMARTGESSVRSLLDQANIICNPSSDGVAQLSIRRPDESPASSVREGAT
jgi:hypothetical protein